jgi:hypothetical protein
VQNVPIKKLYILIDTKVVKQLYKVQDILLIYDNIFFIIEGTEKITFSYYYESNPSTITFSLILSQSGLMNPGRS